METLAFKSFKSHVPLLLLLLNTAECLTTNVNLQMKPKNIIKLNLNNHDHKINIITN